MPVVIFFAQLRRSLAQARDGAALKIQTSYRGYRGRERVKRMKEERQVAPQEHKVHATTVVSPNLTRRTPNLSLILSLCTSLVPAVLS